jgi:hypothetical protein
VVLFLSSQTKYYTINKWKEKLCPRKNPLSNKTYEELKCSTKMVKYGYYDKGVNQSLAYGKTTDMLFKWSLYRGHLSHGCVGERECDIPSYCGGISSVAGNKSSNR